MSIVSHEQPLIVEILNDVTAREMAAGELAAIVHLTNTGDPPKERVHLPEQ